MKPVLLILGAIALVVSCGCANENTATYPVYGVVQFRDGRLLQDGVVEFESMSHKKPVTARAEIGPDGTFSLGTFAARDGALAGSYRIAVISDHNIGTGAERPEMLAAAKLHPKFRDIQRSGLRYTVRPGINEVIVKVRYAPRPHPRKEAEAASRRDKMLHPQ